MKGGQGFKMQVLRYIVFHDNFEAIFFNQILHQVLVWKQSFFKVTYYGNIFYESQNFVVFSPSVHVPPSKKGTYFIQCSMWDQGIYIKLIQPNCVH